MKGKTKISFKKHTDICRFPDDSVSTTASQRSNTRSLLQKDCTGNGGMFTNEVCFNSLNYYGLTDDQIGLAGLRTGRGLFFSFPLKWEQTLDRRYLKKNYKSSYLGNGARLMYYRSLSKAGFSTVCAYRGLQNDDQGNVNLS